MEKKQASIRFDDRPKFSFFELSKNHKNLDPFLFIFLGNDPVIRTSCSNDLANRRSLTRVIGSRSHYKLLIAHL